MSHVDPLNPRSVTAEIDNSAKYTCYRAHFDEYSDNIGGKGLLLSMMTEAGILSKIPPLGPHF